jgi:hypothetical protein
MDEYHMVVNIDGEHDTYFTNNKEYSSVEYSEAETYIPGFTKKIHVRLRAIKTGYS